MSLSLVFNGIRQFFYGTVKATAVSSTISGAGYAGGYIAAGGDAADAVAAGGRMASDQFSGGYTDPASKDYANPYAAAAPFTYGAAGPISRGAYAEAALTAGQNIAFAALVLNAGRAFAPAATVQFYAALAAKYGELKAEFLSKHGAELINDVIARTPVEVARVQTELTAVARAKQDLLQLAEQRRELLGGRRADSLSGAERDRLDGIDIKVDKGKERLVLAALDTVSRAMGNAPIGQDRAGLEMTRNMLNRYAGNAQAEARVRGDGSPEQLQQKSTQDNQLLAQLLHRPPPEVAASSVRRTSARATAPA